MLVEVFNVLTLHLSGKCSKALCLECFFDFYMTLILLLKWLQISCKSLTPYTTRKISYKNVQGNPLTKVDKNFAYFFLKCLIFSF